MATVPIVEKFKQMGYKSEGTELTAESLTASEFDTAWYECDVMPNDQINERRVVKATFAPLQPVGGTTLAKVTGVFEPKASGSDGTAPDWYAILKAAGATVVTDVATFGAENTSGAILGTSCTFKCRDGAYERVSAGTRIAKMRFYAAKGEPFKCEIEGTGRYSQSAEATFVASAYPVSGLPSTFLGATITIGAFTASVAEMEISIENNITPVEDGTHASGYGRNLITDQKLLFKAQVIEDGATDWRDFYRNDAAGDLKTVSVQWGSGTGGVLTWTGTAAIVDNPERPYRDGIGYRSLVGEFVAATTAAALTLTQS